MGRTVGVLGSAQCSLWGSNPRPMAHKTIALTTELREHWWAMLALPGGGGGGPFPSVPCMGAPASMAHQVPHECMSQHPCLHATASSWALKAQCLHQLWVTHLGGNGLSAHSVHHTSLAGLVACVRCCASRPCCDPAETYPLSEFADGQNQW